MTLHRAVWEPLESIVIIILILYSLPFFFPSPIFELMISPVLLQNSIIFIRTCFLATKEKVSLDNQNDQQLIFYYFLRNFCEMENIFFANIQNEEHKSGRNLNDIFSAMRSLSLMIEEIHNSEEKGQIVFFSIAIHFDRSFLVQSKM